MTDEGFPSEKPAPRFMESKRSAELRHSAFAQEVAEAVDKLAADESTTAVDYIAVLERVDSTIDSLVEGVGPEDFESDYDYLYLHREAFSPVVNALYYYGEDGDDECREEAWQALGVYIERLGDDARSFGRDRLVDLAGTMVELGGSEALKRLASLKRASCGEGDSESVSVGKLELFFDPTYMQDSPSFWNGVILSGLSYDRLIQQHPSRFDVEDTCEALTEVMSSGSLGRLTDYVNCFEDLGASESSQYLLQNLRSENPLVRKMSAEILFRLELGKIGVTEEGVEYLGKLYDLGTLNDPEYFVRRLSVNGEMAVIDEETGSIQGAFELNLSGEERVVDAGVMVQEEVRDFLRQRLFIAKADETGADRAIREGYLEKFMENYEVMFNDEFFEGTGVRLNSLELHEQGWFYLHYLELREAGDEEGITRLKNFVKDYGEIGLKAYLSLDYGGSGEEILEFADVDDEILSTEQKAELFKNFYAVANEAFAWRGVFEEAGENVGYEFAPQVHEAFIRKNAEFFKAAQIVARGEGGDVSMHELLQQMSLVARGLHFLGGLTQNNGELSLMFDPDIRAEYASYAGTEITEGAAIVYEFTDGDPTTYDRSTHQVENEKNRIIVNVRPLRTYYHGERSRRYSGGEARMNFRIRFRDIDEEVRIGFDLSDPSDTGENFAVSLDLGIGKPDYQNDVWPSDRVGRVLSLVEGSEGGHNEASFLPVTPSEFADIANQFEDHLNSFSSP